MATTSLSAFTQCCGYLFASIGPFGFGILYDLSDGWTAPLLALCAVVVLQAVAGCLAVRPRFVEDELPAAPKAGQLASEQSGRHRRPALAAAGQPEAVGGGAGHRHRRADDRGQHALGLEPTRRQPRPVGDHLNRGVDRLRSRLRAPGQHLGEQVCAGRAGPARVVGAEDVPRSPSPAADSSASHNAWAATSPSECPAQPSSSGNMQARPANTAGRSRSDGRRCRCPPDARASEHCVPSVGLREIRGSGDLESRPVARPRAVGHAERSTRARVIGGGDAFGDRPWHGPPAAASAAKPCGVCTIAACPVDDSGGAVGPDLPRTNGVDHRQHRNHRPRPPLDRVDHRTDQATGTKARAASWTSTMSASSPTAVRAAATDAIRSAPPATTSRRTSPNSCRAS